MIILVLLSLFLTCIFLYRKEQFRNYQYLDNNNNIINPIEYVQEDVVCLIAMWGRQELVQININLLQNQTKKCKILLVVSSEEDKKFAMKNKGVDWIYTENKPLGKKWQVGLAECKKYNPNAVLINGSDDLLSLNWVETCYHYIHQDKYDIVGKSNWYILDIIKKIPYKLKYVDSNILLGAGRMISRSILDEINWELFPIDQNRGLDTYCNKVLNYHHAKRLICNLSKIFIISLKGEYDTLNSIELILEKNKKIHNIVLQPKYKSFLNKIIIHLNKYIKSISTYKKCIKNLKLENIKDENKKDHISKCSTLLKKTQNQNYTKIEYYINQLQLIKV
jgi:hypothetical protein